jgi:hypothetical protein
MCSCVCVPPYPLAHAPLLGGGAWASGRGAHFGSRPMSEPPPSPRALPYRPHPAPMARSLPAPSRSTVPALNETGASPPRRPHRGHTGCFKQSSPPRDLDRLFRELFGSYGRAARHFGVSRVQLWSWRRGAPLPAKVRDALPELLQKHRAAAIELEQIGKQYLWQTRDRPQRPLQGVCEFRRRRQLTER